MKTEMKAILMLALMAVGCGESAEPGTALAARYMAAEYVGKQLRVDPVYIAEEPIVAGDSAIVTATYRDQQCKLELVKTPLVNQYGWLTKTMNCGKSPLATENKR